MSLSIGPHLKPFVPPPLPDQSDENLHPALKDPFEIEDFTSASEWEKFSAQVEGIIHDFGFPSKHRAKKSLGVSSKDEKVEMKWVQKKKPASFHDCSFWITRHTLVEVGLDNVPESETILGDDEAEATGDPVSKSLKEMMTSDHDFPAGAHPLHYFYGFFDFIVMTSQTKDEVDNQTRAKMCLSTIACSLNPTRCDIPFFVQVMERSRAMFLGIFSDHQFKTNFEMVVLPKRPSNCANLSDLIQIFKEKLSLPYPSEIPSCMVTARRSYVLEDWTSHAWTQTPPDLDLFLGIDMDSTDITRLPFGAIKDPVKRLLLHVTWIDLSEDVVVENDVHSDFDPSEAPQWSVSISFEEKANCLLGDYLNEMMALTDHQETMRQVLGGFLDKKEDPEDNVEKVPTALSKLTGPSYGLRDIINAGKNTSSPDEAFKSGPIGADYLKRILDYLFPDSNPDSKHPYPSEFKILSTANSKMNDFLIPLSNVKSVPHDGLVWRLVIVLSHCRHVFGGLKPVAHLVHEFLLEIRYRWETGYQIPGLPPGTPDHSFCLFHQKLQMINCCIEKKVAREKKKEEIKSFSDSMETSPKGSSDDEEEFFDCDDNEVNDDDDHKKAVEEKKQKDIPVWSSVPEGRLKKLGKVKLLEYTEYLYIPVCQDPAPLTEDTLAEQAEVMMQLGADSAGSEMRAKMQSASLLSDMESFKAANPGSVLGDFVRWYSPRDWIEEEDDTSQILHGKLSTRMEVAGNAWLEAWENAKPVPARRQKRLFDDTKEAEKVLQYLNALKPGEVGEMLLPTLLHVSVCRIIDETLDQIPSTRKIIFESLGLLGRLSKMLCRPEVQHYATIANGDELNLRRSLAIDCIKRLQVCELKLAQALSLRAKFLKDASEVKNNSFPMKDHEEVTKHMENFVMDLNTKKEVKVLGASRGPAGQLIQQMFRDAKRAVEMGFLSEDNNSDIYPSTFSREYILRTSCNRPYPFVKPSPQRIYCCIKDNECRLAGAFSMVKLYS